MHFGGIYFLKATELVIGAAATLLASGKPVELVIAAMSKHPDFITHTLDQYRFPRSSCVILPRISDLELRDIYRSTNLHCMPSHGEGFGIPLIEAASQYTPNLVSPLEVFREVIGDHALFIEDWTVKAVAAAMERAMSADLTNMTKSARARSLDYSFDNLHRTFAVPAFAAIQKMGELR